MTTVKMSVALVVATVLSALLGVQTAIAGTTVLEKDYVGNVENLNRVGGGEPGRHAIPDVASRFAESANTIAEGPPPGASKGGAEGNCDPSQQDPGDNDCTQDYVDSTFPLQLERYTVSGDATLLPSSQDSVNGYATWETNPRCTGSVVEPGGQSIHAWTFGIERPPVTDFQVQICLDVRKCQVNEDNLGSASTPAEVGLFNGNDYIAPVVIRVSHQSGDLWIPGTEPFDLPRTVTNLRIPSLLDVRYPIDQLSESYGQVRPGFAQSPLIPDLDENIDPDTSRVDVGRVLAVPVSRVLDESIAFIGKDCTTKWIRNDGMFRAHDLLKVELSVPSSINVRVRTSQDSAALCYIGTLIPGETIPGDI